MVRLSTSKNQPYCCFFSLDLFFFCFIWVSGFFDSGQILDFSLKKTVVS